jgi:hypothetical protein
MKFTVHGQMNCLTRLEQSIGLRLAAELHDPVRLPADALID